VGIVSWSSGPLNTRARRICGGFTAITPISDYRGWISEGSARLLSFGGEAQPNEAAQPRAAFSWWFSH
jgi:hypothetical protein